MGMTRVTIWFIGVMKGFHKGIRNRWFEVRSCRMEECRVGGSVQGVNVDP